MLQRTCALAGLMTLSIAASGQSTKASRTTPPRPVDAGSTAARSTAAAAAPAAKLPAQFFGTHTYVAYVIFDPNHSSQPTRTRGVGGTLWLGPAGTYEKKLKIPGPYGPYTFNESGRYTVKGNRINFTYAESKGQPVSYGGTFHFDTASLSMGMILNEDEKGGREVFGLVVKGTENVERAFDDNGNVTIK
ncbi:hypothetical protein [Hymenobacter rigui]|uniref:DUF4251 domain-containing protein n=1 Tax=Hymenobacter rigui TaxID=334424 RepID=A0A3R9P2C6_9BACT|nr:hypothetical protein [Hymenobacter rigui]RSK47114.1 hypothetical protein EI291_16075 [Hymenobacter rigui]